MGIIRFLLAISVLGYHSSGRFITPLVRGEIAVQAFYILSGFYMTLVLNEKYIGANNSYKLFLTNRLAKLLPIYWIVLIWTLLYSLAGHYSASGEDFNIISTYMSVKADFITFGYLFVTNLIIFGQDLLMFLGIDPATGHFFFTKNFKESNPPAYSFLVIRQSWTLGIELAFYLIAPFIVKKGLKVVCIFIVISLAIRLILIWEFGLNHDPWTYRFFPSELAFFLFGSISFFLYKKIESIEIPYYIGVVQLVLMVIVTFGYYYVPEKLVPETIRHYIYYVLIVLSIPFLFRSFKNNKTDSMIGDLSYPIYISHFLVINLLNKTNFHFLRYDILYSISLVAGTVVVSIMLNHYVARPIDKYRQSRLTFPES